MIAVIKIVYCSNNLSKQHWLCTNHISALQSWSRGIWYRQTSNIRRTLVGNTFLTTQMQLEHRLSWLPQLHLNTWLQWIGQWQLHDETWNISVLRFGATYMGSLTVHVIIVWIIGWTSNRVRKCNVCVDSFNSPCLSSVATFMNIVLRPNIVS